MEIKELNKETETLNEKLIKENNALKKEIEILKQNPIVKVNKEVLKDLLDLIEEKCCGYCTYRTECINDNHYDKCHDFLLNKLTEGGY